MMSVSYGTVPVLIGLLKIKNNEIGLTMSRLPDEFVYSRVPDPDPHVFGPPGSGSTSQMYGSGSCSGSGSFYHHAKIVRITMIPTIFVTLFDFLSLKNDMNVPSKSNKQKNLC